MTDKKTQGMAAPMAKTTFDAHPVLLQTHLNTARTANLNCPPFSGAD
jgi:hypothetical protein